MRRTILRWAAVSGLALLITTSAGVAAPDSPAATFEIAWWTVEGGRSASADGSSAGGLYTLSGLAGQADAQPSTGGVYALTRGFWNDTITAPYRLYLPVVRK